MLLLIDYLKLCREAARDRLETADDGAQRGRALFCKELIDDITARNA